jgi:type I restriction enzyme S subunit
VTEHRTALPEGWEWREIRDVTQEVPNVDPRRAPNKSFSYIDIASIDNKRLVVTDPKPLTGMEAPSRARRPVQSGDVVFSNVRTYLRNVARINGAYERAIASTGFTVLRPTHEVTTDFLFRYVASDEFLELITPQQTGTEYPATSDRVVRSQPIPIPPIGEQRRIAAWLDEIEARRTSVNDRLAATRTIAARLRAACSPPHVRAA